MRKKLWLIPSSVLGAIAPIALSAGCGHKTAAKFKDGKDNALSSEEIFNQLTANKASLFNLDDWKNGSVYSGKDFTNFNDKFSKQRKYATYSLSADVKDAFQFDSSSWYGSYQATIAENTYGSLFRIQNIFSPIIKTTYDSNGEAHVKTYRPSIWKYKMELAKEVVVTYEDGGSLKTEVFDNDNIDVFPDYSDSQEKTFAKNIYQSKSTDNKSINSDHFSDLVNRAKQIQVTVKDDVKWIKNDGTETNFNVKPEDFYVSWLRTNLRTKTFRAKYSSSTAGLTSNDLDQLAINVYNDSSAIRFTENDNYQNIYVYQLFGANATDWFDKSKFIENVTVNGKNESSLTFKNTGNSNSFFQLFDLLATTTDWAPAPSDYILSKASDPVVNSFKNSADKATLKNKLIQLNDEDKNNILVTTGEYWYGAMPNDILYASPYYYQGYDENASADIYKKNTHYTADNDFLNSNNNYLELINYYKPNSNVSADSWKSILWDRYVNGELSKISNHQINDSNLLNAIRNPYSSGYKNSPSLNKTDILSEQMWNILPGKYTPKSEDNETSYYNDYFSYLMYGASYKDVHEGNLKGESQYARLLTSYGAAFRSLISAAINWNDYSNVMTSGSGISWINQLAEDGLINGSNQSSSKFKTPRDAYEKINTVYAVDKDLNKISGIEVTPSDNAARLKLTSVALESLKSSKFDEIKTAMKTLLDDFENDMKTNHPTEWAQIQGQKASWKYIKYGYSYIFPSSTDNYANLTTLINSLDDRLDFSALKYPEGNGKIIENYANQNGGAYKWVGWSYDYDQIGSGLDGITTNNSDIALVLIGQSNVLQNKLQSTFPKIVEVAKALVQWIKVKQAANEINVSVPIDKWINVESKYLVKFYSDLGAYGWDSSKNEIIIKPEKDSTVSSLNSFMSRFFFEFDTKKTNEYLVDLANELMNFNGVVFDELRYIYPTAYKISVSSPYELTPFSQSQQVWLNDNVVVSKK